MAGNSFQSDRCPRFFAYGIGVAIVLGVWGLPATCVTAQEFYQRDFVGLAQKPSDWGYYGPNAENFVKFEPEGLRINLPVLAESARPETGLATQTTLKGDFEVTMRYEILAEPTVVDVGNNHTRITLCVQFAAPDGAATLSRRMHRTYGPQLFSWISTRDKVTVQPMPSTIQLPPTAKKGRLRIVRKGDKIFYRSAEDDALEFRELASLPVGAADIAEVRIVATTLGPKGALDVRVMDLQIRADAIAKTPTAPPPPPAINFVAPTKQYAQEYFQSFKTGTAKPPGWEFTGPDIETSLRFEPAGAHFTLPAGWKGTRTPTGMKSIFGPKGDFEITMHFEIIAEPAQADAGTPVGTRTGIGIIKDTPHNDTTTLGRVIATNSGRVIIAWATVWNEEAGKMVPHTGYIKPTKAMVGRLRMVRSGGDLYYGVSDGLDGDFQFFKKYPFGSEDIRELRITTGTGTENASLDSRVTDLRVRADAIPNMPASSPVQQGAVPAVQPPPPPSGKGWLAIALGGGLAITVLAALALGGVLLLRRRNGKSDAAVPAAFVSIECPGCGKKLKVKAELIGKKVKCSQCGDAVLVATDN